MAMRPLIILLYLMFYLAVASGYGDVSVVASKLRVVDIGVVQNVTADLTCNVTSARSTLMCGGICYTKPQQGR